MDEIKPYCCPVCGCIAPIASLYYFQSIHKRKRKCNACGCEFLTIEKNCVCQNCKKEGRVIATESHRDYLIRVYNCKCPKPYKTIELDLDMSERLNNGVI